MTISLIYRVEVHIPEHVFREYGHTPEYEQAVLRATKGGDSGSDRHSEVYEWAETDSMTTAQAIETALNRIAKGDLT